MLDQATESADYTFSLNSACLLPGKQEAIMIPKGYTKLYTNNKCIISGVPHHLRLWHDLNFLPSLLVQKVVVEGSPRSSKILGMSLQLDSS